MKIYYPIEVDLYHQYPLPKMNAQQNNIGRGALVTLTAAGAIIDPTGEAVTFWAKKPDGTVSFLPATQSGTQIQIEFTNQMLAVPGDVQVEIRMTGSDNTDLSTPIFTVQVNPSNIKDGAVESQNEFSALQTFMAELAELKETGLKGDPGVAATIRVGKVTESEPGADPTVTNVGTEQAAVFDFTLPRGPAGPAGPEGGKELFFGARSTFPDTGDSKILYIDDTVDPALSYIWTGGKYVPAGGGGDITAAEVEYDNKTSGLKSSTVQGAIDENAAGIKSLNSNKAKYIFIEDSSISNDPIEVVKKYWVNIPDGFYVANISCGGSFYALMQKISTGQYGMVYILGYGIEQPIYRRCISGSWI